MEAFKNTLQHRIYGGALYCCIMDALSQSFVLLAEAVPENRYAGLLLVILLVSEAAVLGRMAMLAADAEKGGLPEKALYPGTGRTSGADPGKSRGNSSFHFRGGADAGSAGRRICGQDRVPDPAGSRSAGDPSLFRTEMVLQQKILAFWREL